MKRISSIIAAAAIAAGALVVPSAGAATVAPATIAGDTALSTITEIDPSAVPADVAGTKWYKKYKDDGRVEKLLAHSPSMDRDIPLAVIKANDANRPTIYLLNGAGSAEQDSDWLSLSDAVDFYHEKNVNVVVAQAGAFSYFTDWEQEPNGKYLQGPQKWETFLTRELPQAIEPALKANDKRAIAGMSMTGTTSLLFAEHHPGFYDSVGSFSGCAATTTGLTPKFIDLVLNRGGTDFTKMWGPINGEVARNNDALINAEKLRGQKNIYVSTSSGFPGEHDMPWSKRVNGQPSAAAQVIFEGSVIEGATNACTRDLARKTNSLNIPVTYNFRPAGTHQWGYWQDDLRGYWDHLVAGLGTGVKRPPLKPTEPISPQDYWAGSTSGS